ncbi:hypothetical protein [Runella sp.]|jgi:hydrogenase-4 component E|uniref:hypothetical protein n=1 Tax=Runella sp. TaxID=1960881 RepID=UPI002632700F|nr:hypothetical protein [Runella sp.]
MATLLIIIFAVTLIYLAISERPIMQNRLLGFQGLLLFGIAIVQTTDFHPSHVFFIVSETLLVKAIAIPFILEWIRKHNKVIRTKRMISGTLSVVIVTNILIISFLLCSNLHNDHLQTKFFSVATASVLAGIFFIISNRNVYSHLIGYLVMENGIFLVSLAVGTEMPLLINMAIVLDIFFGVLVLGVFLRRVGRAFEGTDIDFLSNLKD